MTDRDRPSPYDLVFGARSMDDTLFPPIAGEAEARDHPLRDPDRFAFLTSVGRLLQAIAGAPDPEDGGEAFRQHARLVFHAFHFWRDGRQAFELGTARIRSLLDDGGQDSGGADPDDGASSPPALAGYLRLPRNLIWAAAAPGLTPEPMDGFFWVLDAPGDAPGDAPRAEPAAEPASGPGALHLLLALGVRPDRPGFSVITATGALDAASDWATMDARPGGQDFATTLPGGELDRLYSIETTAEVLKLASLCFDALARDRG